MHGESPANTLCFRRKHLYIQTKDVASGAMTYINLSRTYCRNPEHATPFRSSVSWAFGFFNSLTIYTNDHCYASNQLKCGHFLVQVLQSEAPGRQRGGEERRRE